MTICQLDSMRCYTGKCRELDKDEMRKAIPAGWIAAPVPDVPEGWYALWRGDDWLLTREYPKPPPPEPGVKHYDPDKLVLACDGMGKAKALRQIIEAAPDRTYLRWQKAVTFAGNDPDLVTMLGGIQQAWRLTDEQVAAILKQCEV